MMWWRALGPVLLAVLLVGAGAAPASAHATLVSSDPAEGEVLPNSPGEVRFTFDEPVSLVADGVQVFDADGEPVPATGSARDEIVVAEIPDELADGTYVVTWRIVSNDGHPVAGSLTFAIGTPSATVEPPKVGATTAHPAVSAAVGIVQGLGYAALLLACGLLFFREWTSRGLSFHAEVRRRLGLVVRIAAVLAVAAAALLVPLAGAYQQGLGPAGLLQPSSYAVDLVGDPILVLLLHVVGLALAVRLAGVDGPAGTLGLIGGAAALWSPALVGHTRAYEPATLLVLTDALHLSAGAVWLGGLVGLALVLGSVAGRERDAGLLLSRFTTVAAALLGVLVVTGVLLGWRILGSWSLLLETDYGRLLLVKVGIAAVVASVAAWNRFGLVPRLGSLGHDARLRAARLLRRTVAVEVVLLVVLLAVTGFLVQQPPTVVAGAGATPAATGAVSGLTEDHRVVAVLDATPGRQRQLTVQVQDSAGEPIELSDVPAVSLRAVDGSTDLGSVPLQPTAAGTYRADVVFPTPGEWEVQISLPVDRFTNPVTALVLEVE